jgi:predicted nucleic acid-binding protein
MVVFDSSILIDALRKKKDALDLINYYFEKEQIAITVISKYEILRGANLITGLLARFIIYDFEDASIMEAVKIYRKVKAKGKLVSELDVLVAGIAATNNETLITRDKDFLNFETERIRVV